MKKRQTLVAGANVLTVTLLLAVFIGGAAAHSSSNDTQEGYTNGMTGDTSHDGYNMMNAGADSEMVGECAEMMENVSEQEIQNHHMQMMH